LQPLSAEFTRERISAAVLDALCRAHLLRLLSCPPSVMVAAFRLPER
jgi:hypothetical protein